MTRMLSYSRALNEALTEEMEKNKDLLVLGQDIGKMGGVWGLTKSLQERFGKDRIIDSPISEPSMVGLGLGAAINGKRFVVDIQRIEFVMLSMSMIVNEVTKARYLSQGRYDVPLLIHTLTGALGIAGPQHSQSLESLFLHIPGLKIVTPSNAYEAKGLLKASLQENDPVLFVDHVRLNLTEGEVPHQEYMIPLGKARVVTQGTDITIVSNSYALYRLEQMLPLFKDRGISIELVDMRTLAPLDYETVTASVNKTKTLLVVHDAGKTGGYGVQIVAHIVEHSFNDLMIPPYVIGGEDYPIPHSPRLAKEVLLSEEKILKMVEHMMRQKSGCACV